jgi:four helix bundle protein
MSEVSTELAIAFRARSKSFALRIIRLVESLPRKPSADIIGRQVFRSATSVAANYRAAQRARSKAEFISKISIVVEEADETVFWLEILQQSGLIPAARLQELSREANELLAIFAASQRTSRRQT